MIKWEIGKSENGYGEEGIILKGGDGRIISVVKSHEGILFTEECDGYFSELYSKEEALLLIEELKDWINS